MTAQEIAPGQWRDYLSYRQAKRLAFGDEKIFCSTDHSLFYYDLTDNSVNKISKIQGLTNTSISVISYAAKQKALLIAYTNSSIDLYKQNKVITIPYLKNKIDINNKRINEITLINDTAYLSCGFGIVSLDLDKQLFKNTYYPGSGQMINEVYDVCTDGTYLYAATETGIYKGLLYDPYLIDYSHWELVRNFGSAKCKGVEYYDNKLFARVVTGAYMKDSIVYFDGLAWKTLLSSQNFESLTTSNNCLLVNGSYSVFIIKPGLDISRSQTTKDDFTRYALFDNLGRLWMAHPSEGLVLDGQEALSIFPDGPFAPDVSNVELNNDDIWVANGTVGRSFNSTYNNTGFSVFRNGKWEYYTSFMIPGLEYIRDISNVKINPKNPQQAFFTSFSSGLLEFNNDKFTIYNNKNSGIQEDYLQSGLDICLVYGIDFDKKGNIWMTNSRAKRPLVVKTSDSWHSYSLPGLTSNYIVGPLIITPSQHKWVISPTSSTIIAFDENGTWENTDDDDVKVVSISGIESLIQSNFVYSIAQDRDENIWVGTDAGPIRISSPQNVFNDRGIGISKIKVSLSKEDNSATFLLEQEKINSITFDGANRKWFGTESSGAYLISSDGTKEIMHFTAENSPLLSNNVLDIDVHPTTGEVFFSTDKGLISYRGNSTKGSDDFGDVYVFPNPVRENFEGDIMITNLLTDADVRITDITGNLVYKTKALGGQAVWNGKNLLGKRVNTGVYLIFCSNEDGSKTFVTKLLFIH